MEDKNLDFKDVRHNFISHINLWLTLSERAKQKKLGCNRFDKKKEMRLEDETEYWSMAHANFMLGQKIGVVTSDDFPQFAPKKFDLVEGEKR